MAKLQGWDWIKSLMKKCPECHQTPTLGNPAIGSKKWVVVCMNCCCNNFKQFYDDNPFLAIQKWNEGV